MQKNEDITIQFDRKKFTLISIGSLLAFILSSYFISLGYVIITLIAVIPLVISFFLFLFCIKMMFISKPTLIINNNGIYEYTKGKMIKKVLWSDVTNINKIEASSVSFVSFEVKDLFKYLEEGTIIERLFKGMNTTFYRTPVHISSMHLKTDFENLYKIINDKFESQKIN